MKRANISIKMFVILWIKEQKNIRYTINEKNDTSCGEKSLDAFSICLSSLRLLGHVCDFH